MVNVRENIAYLIAGEELIAFFCENRFKIIIVLENASEVQFSVIKAEILNYLDELFMQYLRSIKKDFKPVELADIQPLIRTIYESLLNSIIGLLKIYPEKDDLRLILPKLLDYHLFGLNGLLR